MPLVLRILLTFLLLCGVGMLALWLRDHPGNLQMDWLGYRIETPLAVAVSGFLVLILTLGLLLYGLVRLSHFPLRYRLRKQEARWQKSLDTVTYSLTSLAVSDHAGALRYAQKAEQLIGEHPILELVRAHVARRHHDMPGTRQQLEKMLEHPTTRMLAASALAHLAQRENRLDEATALAAIAHGMQPQNKPALLKLFDLHIEQQAWDKALELLETSRKPAHLTRGELNHYRALLFWCEARALEEAGDRTGSLLLAKEAHKAEPGFLPATLYYASHLIAHGQQRQAVAVLNRSWRRQPHPELAALMMDMSQGLGEKRFLKRIETMTKSNPDHVESQLARGLAAMRMEHWDVARNHLKAALAQEEQSRIYRQLAALERQSGQGEQAAVRWLEKAATARPDPAWLCELCHHRAPQWQLHCSHCGSFDSIAWHSPDEHRPHAEETFAIPYEMAAPA